MTVKGIIFCLQQLLILLNFSLNNKPVQQRRTSIKLTDHAQFQLTLKCLVVFFIFPLPLQEETSKSF